jgi:serine/threonine-protein kinase
MGEVYRANDTKLGQLVALKFLAAAAARDERMLARLHGEVRIARQVSHPNVCRVYDIAEYQGSPFLTMEYVDGEDLASLLRRIGRLSGDKAIEIARRLCAGLAAAHDKGVLHRDLKPANVMIDGRGQVLITDFGLAALAGQVQEGEIRSGTPAYMAPEQLAGREVTVRSDIYALGLVLYEMFTGKRAADDPSQRPVPASGFKDIDPAVESVILRCLAEDPKQRPASALAVAAALPGGDPLAAALAAGETPSPEMVAAAGEHAGLPVRTGVMWLAVAAVGLVLALWLGGETNILSEIPFDHSSDALSHKARDLLATVGYPAPPLDRAWGFSLDSEFDKWGQSHLKIDRYRSLRASGQPAFAYFWYRESPRYLEPLSANGIVAPWDPPPEISGMIDLQVDPQGRLLRFESVPPQLQEPAIGAVAPADWKPLFAAAGLDMTRFAPAEPKWLPLASLDARAAWTGTFPQAAEIPLRVEAASWRGKPVFFRLIAPWDVPARMQVSQESAAERAATWLFFGVVTLIFAAAALLAWRNCRLGRGDIRGASRLAFFVAVLPVLEWAFSAHHVPAMSEYFGFNWALANALWWAAAYWALYVALEPYVRRRWPQSLIAWTRLLSGGLRDPLVGEHALIGVAVGIATAIIVFVRFLAVKQYGEAGLAWVVSGVSDARQSVAGDLVYIRTDIGFALGLLFFFFLLRALLRRQWAAVAAFLLITVAPVAASIHHLWIATPLLLLIISTYLFVLIRYGVLAAAVTYTVTDILAYNTPTLDFSAWYSGRTIFTAMLILGLALYGFRTALAGRPLLKAGFLES